MSIRRVLASNVGGKSQVIDDTSGISNAFEHVHGFDPALLWKTAPGRTSRSGSKSSVRPERLAYGGRD